MPDHPLITLTTDFGLHDHYVGAMKGAILGINPEARIVDVCNSVQPFDLLDGALTIEQAYSLFPANTIHLVIVDPGVGTSRRPLVVRAGSHYFIAPDNGVLSLVYAREERISARSITAQHYFRQPVSQTFHGRDVFAPIAAHLSKGLDAANFGPEVGDFQRFALPRPRQSAPGVLHGLVIKVDRFGNLITNFRAEDVAALTAKGAPFRFQIGGKSITRLVSSYAQGGEGEPFCIVGSLGYLEVAMNQGSAAAACGAGKSSEAVLTAAA